MNIYNRCSLILILLIFYSLKSFSQTDSIPTKKLNYRIGVGIFCIPGLYVEKNIPKNLSIEAGLITFIFFNEASVGLKYQLLNKNDFRIKAGIGCGMTAFFWNEKTYPSRPIKDIFILPLIPVEFSYKKVSLELQPGYPIKMAGSDEGKIPIIVFLSYINPPSSKNVRRHSHSSPPKPSL